MRNGGEAEGYLPGQATEAVRTRAPDLLCFSHLRWNFVYQRPQHLLSRGAQGRRVFFFEEPIPGGAAGLSVRSEGGQVHVAVPRLPAGMEAGAQARALRGLVEQMIRDHAVEDYVLWYSTPMALPFTRGLAPAAVLYDCMDELSGFAGAPPDLVELEAELLRRADVVLTGGQSLYEAKRGRHPSVHAFPSSVDVAHFAAARERPPEPADQAAIPRPRLGYAGVIDERMDLDLIAELARLRPAWQIVLVGPVAKIDPARLPRGPNLHWLGQKPYAELPAYLAGWDVALVPFARNAATRFISPTKTPEYLAAGRPVVSTSIRDVVRPYGELGLVHIADTPAGFVSAAEACLAEGAGGARQDRADALLSQTSWDRTWAAIEGLLDAAVAARRAGEAYRV